MTIHYCLEWPCPYCINSVIDRRQSVENLIIPNLPLDKEPFVSNIFETIDAKKSELDNLIKDYGETAIKEYLAEFWKQNPDILAIKWQQYTPYFNDGDPCVFNVYDVRAKIARIGEEDGGDYEDGFYDSWSLGYELFPDVKYEERNKLVDEHPAASALKKLNQIWQNNEQTLLVVFGDHVEITATPEEIQVDEHYHD